MLSTTLYSFFWRSANKHIPLNYIFTSIDLLISFLFNYSSYYDYIQLISALISWLQCNSPLPVWLSQGIPMYNSNLVKKRDLFKTPLNNTCLWRNIVIIANAYLLFWTFFSFMHFEMQWISWNSFQKCGLFEWVMTYLTTLMCMSQCSCFIIFPVIIHHLPKWPYKALILEQT